MKVRPKVACPLGWLRREYQVREMWWGWDSNLTLSRIWLYFNVYYRVFLEVFYFFYILNENGFELETLCTVKGYIIVPINFYCSNNNISKENLSNIQYESNTDCIEFFSSYWMDLVQANSIYNRLLACLSISHLSLTTTFFPLPDWCNLQSCIW